MAFSIFPTKYTNRRDKLEEILARRRNKESDYRQTWENNSRYFKNSDIKSQKYMELTSPALQQQSLEAFNNKKYQEERELWLQDRRSKLSSLLRSEDENYEEEIREMLSGSGHREVTENNSVNGGETMQMSSLRKEKESQPEDELSQDGSKKSVRVSPDTKSIVEDIKLKEAKAEKLKDECGKLHERLEAVKNFTSQRTEYQQQIKIIPWSNRLSRPYKVLVQMKGQEVSKFLEFEKCFMNLLLRVASDCLPDDADLSSLKQEIYTVKDVLERHLDDERRQLANTDQLFHEEAASLWYQRCEEWDTKQRSRDAVIAKIGNCVKTALDARMGDLLQHRKHYLDESERLLNHLQNSML